MRPFETLLLLACVAWLIQFASVARPDNSSWSASLQVLLGVLLVLAWKNAGYIGLDRFLLPLLGTPWQRVPAPSGATRPLAAPTLAR